MILKWLFVLITQCVLPLSCEIYQDRPKIKPSNGDLILEPALDKNLYLRTQGPRSTIFFGNIDILKANTPKDVILNQPAINRNTDLYLNNPSGILQRLEKLENKKTRLSNSISSNFTKLWRKVNRLNRKMLALQNQINSRPQDECNSHPCEHGATCLNLVDGYHCLCPSNWEGLNCDDDVNECRNFAGTDLGCQNGAICVNRPGTYECLCQNGWYGLHCTRKAKDCSGGDFEMCGHGTCVPVTSGNGIKCICHQGWTSNATSTICLTDVNECESYQGARCSMNPKVECTNLPGSFKCGECPVGYEGNGYMCNDIDECIVSNGGCSPLVTCHNTIGSRICGSCPPGYEGDGMACAYVGLCNINNGGCHPSAHCIEGLSPTSQVAQCMCPEGMNGDGIGFMGCYVSTSNDTEGCKNNPCGSHGRCHTLHSGYTCICYEGHSGAHCEISTDVCNTNPCQNGGFCQQDATTIAGFRCECTAQYSGALCQVRLNSCGGLLDAEEGSIAFPLSNTTINYNNDAQCAWVIHTKPDKVINVTFSKFNIERTPECSSDFLQIHDGRKSSSQLIGRFCGDTLPKGGNIISSHNNLYFWFHSDGTVTNTGFSLHWTSITPICGGKIDATTHGHISSPGSPGDYPPNRDCYWQLATTPGKRISLYFFNLDIETHANCSFDYLAIYDGEHITDPLLSMYCNSTQPAPVQSASSNIFIHFHSDGFGSGQGFQISYAPTEGIPGCGGYFTADKGEIVSPTYNGQYLSNLLCEYTIKTSAGTKIKLNFMFFNIEYSFRCGFDYLKIYNGPSSDSNLVGKFCGTTFPSSYTSSTNTLFLKFKTDHAMVSEGFRISYEAICNNTLLGDSGIIKSPAYPFSYPANKVCEYLITTEPGKAIVLKFQDFDIEDSRYHNCQYDYVEIRDGLDLNSTLLGRYCGGSEHTPPVLISTHNYMYIRFKSDVSLSGTGFYANYTTIDTQCGGIYRDTTGLINHPSGDATTYQNDQTCQWLIIAPEGMRIKLSWNRFDIEDNTGCDGDSLELVEVSDDNENESLGKYCGPHSPPTLTTSTNRLILKFLSDYDLNYAGFSVSYTFLDERTHCGGNYIKSHGIILSPGWPARYALNRDCLWTIKVPAGQQISLNITDFDLERPVRNKCNLGDYLEIRNGDSENSPLIGQFCGHFDYKRITSMSNTLHLRFHSDFYYTGRGFHIEWDGTIRGCGGTLTSSSGSIASPNYPNAYDDNTECFYRIVTSAGSRIRISFLELDLEKSPFCRDDYIALYDGRDTNAQSLGKYCFMTSELNNIETTSNYAFIKFRSDIFSSARGFLLNYNIICNNNLTGRYGVIESPNYPDYYPLDLNCLWNVQVPKGNIINVTFTHFDIYQTPRLHRMMVYSHVTTYIRMNASNVCYPDYLQMKETRDPFFSVKYCGQVLPDPLSTKSNSFDIKFSSGSYVARTGFRLEWASYGCGGHIKKQTGTINLGQSLTNNMEIECEWLIETPPGKGISITFTHIYMSDSNNCSMDFIEIYNGQNMKAPHLSKLCYQAPTTIQSESNFMLIRFVKQSNLRDVHFTAKFRSVDSKCGGFIKSLSGFFYSKNYPQNYDNNLDCIWYLVVPENHRIEINFIHLDLYSDTYSDLVTTSSEDNCKDSILIYDNNNIGKTLTNYTYRICPNSNITQIVTKYNNVAVQFMTNSVGTAKGFKANFTVTCGATILATHDDIITNNRFINQKSKSCVWIIIAPSLDQKISLTLTHLSIPKDNNIVTNKTCPSTYLRILDGNDKDAPLIDEYCGRKIPPMIVSHGNSITIELGSYTQNITGLFEAHYSPITNACGGSFTAEEGSIASPFYPSAYPLDIDCEWVINTSPGNTVYIIFERFDVEYSERCNEDYLEIRKNNGGGQLLGVYCGNDIPTNYIIAPTIYIKFHSNSKTTAQGFLLHYAYLHENEIQEDSGQLASPLYPVPYEGAGEYVWRIFTSGKDGIVVAIDELEIASHGDINYNKLIIYDGYDKNAPILDELQGVLEETKTIQSISSVVCIVLAMDKSNTGTIFHMSWTKSSENGNIKTKDSINCGSNKTQLILAGEIALFKSPNHPKNYFNNLNCEWVYRTQMGRHLSIMFNSFSLEENQSCFADYISIYSADLFGDWKPIKERICEKTTVSDELDSSIYMKIKFNTDSSYTRLGFQAVVNSKCGGVITDLSGEFSPLWSDVFQNRFTRSNVKCEWKIKVRPGRTIQLKFTHFNITNEIAKCETFVILRNGDSVESPLLESGKYCGMEHEKKTNIETSSNSLFVSYTAKININPFVFQNFKIYYEEKRYECGLSSKLTSDHTFEIINSPNYPNTPLPYSECVWVFSGPPGDVVRVDFIDRFDLDHSDDCSMEVVEIRDGSSNLSPLIGRYCGGNIPGTVKSTSNAMYIKYLTQLSVPRNGFKSNVSIDICGGTIVGDSGQIISPGYPQLQVLPPGTTCQWRIIGPPQHTLIIKPVDVHLPPSLSPCDTKIDIEESLPFNNTYSVFKTICNDDIQTKNSIPTIQTSDNIITIKLTFGKRIFISNLEYRGFTFSYNASLPVCGGKVTESEGFITTPGYPQLSTLQNCQWYIEVPDKSRRIRLELIDADFEKQKIFVFNDLEFNSRITSIPNDNTNTGNRIFESVGNKLSMYMYLQRYVTSHRFKAKFSSDEQALCGGELSGLNQELNSPDFQRSYTCEWHYNNQINSDFGNENNLTYNSIFITAKVNSSVTRTRCLSYNPQLIIKSPVNNKGLIIRRLICGNTDVSYYIPSSIMDIIATKSKTPSFYFNFNLKVQPCGGSIDISENPVNILNNIPNYNNDTLNCAWILNNPTESRVQIKMEGLFLLECDDENINIRGLDQYNNVIGSYCKGRLMESPLITHFSYMLIEYHSNIKNSTEIKLMTKSDTNSCGGLLKTHENIFTSPNYPKSYQANQECAWEIEVDVGFRISLKFIDRFMIEDEVNCTKDVIIIYDWAHDNYNEIVRVCGREAPPTYNSTNNRMKIVFRTDSESHHDGFKAQWTSICGGNFKATEKEQILYSPGFPNAYSPNMHCIYEIYPAKRNRISLKFIEFHLEGSFPKCLFDNLTITSDSSYLAPRNDLYRVLCGKQIPAAIQSSNKLTLDFKTDRLVQRKGFKLTFSLNICGGRLNDTTIITTSPDTDNYDDNMNCTWIVNAPPNKIVVVKFMYFELESSPDCSNDYVALYDGLNIDTEKRLALLCGYDYSTTVVRSSVNSMVLEFIREPNVSHKGFKAVISFSYSEAVGCGAKITLTHSSPHILKSPLIGSNTKYENFLDCEWAITSPPDTVIKIIFTSFHISPCQDINQTAITYSKCDCDYVEIKDDLNLNSLVIGTYCGHALPPQLISSKNVMSVRLYTDGELNSSGFVAILSVEQALCGPSVIPVSFKPHRFKSPGYDSGSIPRGLHCIYHLKVDADPDSEVRITLIDFHLRPSETEGTTIVKHCNKDKLIISSDRLQLNITTGKDLIINQVSNDFFGRLFYNEMNIQLPKLFELCGHENTVDMYVYGSTSLNLITSPDTDHKVHRGFEIEVAFIGSCGRNYSESQGRIRSYHSYKEQNSNISCFTLITAPKNYTISLYFITVTEHKSGFEIEDDTYIEIFDGNNTSARQLLKIEDYYSTKYPVFSTGRYMLLHNHRNGEDYMEFDVNYVTTDKGVGCGGKLSNIMGAIASPYFPKTYKHKSICDWELETPQNSRLLLRFTEFDLGMSCDQNYVELVDRNGAVVRTFCAETPANFKSEDNYIKIISYTTMTNSGRGWSAHFVAVIN